MKGYKKYIIPLLVTLVLFAVAEFVSPGKTDWSLSFSRDDKKPFGSYIVSRVLPELFPDSKIQTSIRPVYNTLKDQEDTNSVYIIINDKFEPGEMDLKALMDFVRRGNNVFISASKFGKNISDSLKLGYTLSLPAGKYIISNFTNTNLRSYRPYMFKGKGESFSFPHFDTSASIVLGKGERESADFLKISLGRGNFYLNSLPVAFTNYSILDSLNADYIYKAFSYLPSNGKVYWDEYYKAGRDHMKGPFQFIISTEALSWAYNTLLFSIILYIIFAGRRRQRIIPVMKTPANSTLEFVSTVGSLYYQQGDHKNIAAKKITYFLDQVRSRYMIKTDELNDETLGRISARSGIEAHEVKELFGYIGFINASPKIKKEELHKLNTLIESFYKKAGIHE